MITFFWDAKPYSLVKQVLMFQTNLLPALAEQNMEGPHFSKTLLGT
jgi:hypothetical protein